ncbi:cytochrome b N-terminal domain-containing protein [Halobaculum rarum]|uniref:cytochrome b N-terminal domain-containing protein n=1 Tax=Halobaculum rarum TaxID=3075122 RepID=UPI0032AF09FC
MMPSDRRPSSDSADALEPALLVVVAVAVAADLASLARLIPPPLGEATRTALALAAGLAALIAVTHAVASGSPAAGLAAAVAVPLAALYAYTGLLLPWTQLSFVLGQAGVELALSVPLVGEPVARALFGGFTLSEATLEHAFRIHYAIVAVAVVAVLGRAGAVLRGHVEASPA